MNTMDMHERLKTARKDAGFASASQAASSSGWTVSTYVAHENGQNRYDTEAAEKYAKKFKVSAGWLLTGEGATRTQTMRLVGSFDPDAHDPEVEFDPGARRSDFPGDAIVELAARGGMGAGQTIETTYRRDGAEITCSDALKDDYWRFPDRFVRNTLAASPSNLLIAESQGDSMVPTIFPKDPVCIDTSHTKPSPDGVYALRDDFGEVIFKRLELVPGSVPTRLRIVSDNPLHSSYERNAEDVNVIGKVLFKLHML